MRDVVGGKDPDVDADAGGGEGHGDQGSLQGSINDQGSFERAKSKLYIVLAVHALFLPGKCATGRTGPLL